MSKNDIELIIVELDTIRDSNAWIGHQWKKQKQNIHVHCKQQYINWMEVERLWLGRHIIIMANEQQQQQRKSAIFYFTLYESNIQSHDCYELLTMDLFHNIHQFHNCERMLHLCINVAAAAFAAAIWHHNCAHIASFQTCFRFVVIIHNNNGMVCTKSWHAPFMRFFIFDHLLL